jgi:hypothetical protein
VLPSSPSDQPSPDASSPADATLGGYIAMHDRPPAYAGIDGHPYTVSLEVERTTNLRAPYAGYLVFPRWAQTGVGIVGHVETPTLCECASQDEAMRRLGELTLLDVQRLLSEAIARSQDDAQDEARE